jgi:hypothetical protein
MPATVRIPAKRSKYGSKITEYGGRKFHSAAEAKQAAELDLLLKCKQIISWDAQVPMPIRINGTYICTLILDFGVHETRGNFYYIETKGFETAIYRLKMKLLRATYPNIDVRVVKA